MVCAIVICALLAGGGPLECAREPGSITLVERANVPPDLRACAAEFQRFKKQVDDGETPLPVGLRLQRFDLVRREYPQEARR